MKRSLLLVVLLFYSVFAAEVQWNPAAKLGRKIITGEELLSAGVTRIGELLLLVDEWSLSTTEGFTWMASPNGLAPYQGQTWIVMVDGQRFELNSFDVKNLYLLPVTLDQIDYVEIVNVPLLHEGEFTERGLIHIHTVRPEPGLSLHGTLVLGNETGDTGPYRYTKYRTPNVDRSANDASLSVAFGRNTWYARASLTVQQHPFTDFAMLERITETIDDWAGLHMSISPALNIGFNLSRSHHELSMGYPFSREYYLFFKPLGREIPVTNAFPFVGVRGSFITNRSREILYRVKYSGSELGKYLDIYDFDFSYKSHNLNANVESIYRSNAWQTHIGIGFDRFRLETDYQLETDSYNIGKVYGGLRFEPAIRFSQYLSTLITYSEGEAAGKVGLISDWDITPKHNLIASYSFSQRLFVEDNSLWYWSERGYDLLGTYDIDYAILGQISRSRQLTRGLTWKTAVGNDLILEISRSFRSFTDLYLESQSFQFNPLDCSFASPIDIHAGEEGQVRGVKVTIKYSIGSYLSQQMYYGYWKVVSGSDAFRAAWNAIPQHNTSYRLNYAPADNFMIGITVHYRSATTWSDYQGIEDQLCAADPRISTTYSAQVAEARVVDLELQKWFWRRKIIGNLLLRNLSNSNYNYHPIGASFDLSMYIKVELVLDS